MKAGEKIKNKTNRVISFGQIPAGKLVEKRELQSTHAKEAEQCNACFLPGEATEG